MIFVNWRYFSVFYGSPEPGRWYPTKSYERSYTSRAFRGTLIWYSLRLYGIKEQSKNIVSFGFILPIGGSMYNSF